MGADCGSPEVFFGVKISPRYLYFELAAMVSPQTDLEASATIKMGDNDEKHPTDEHHPRDGVWMLKFGALKKLAEDHELGKRTSHEYLATMQEHYKKRGGAKSQDVWSGGPPQMKIMEELAMFKTDDFQWITFEQLLVTVYIVLTYTWADSKWSEMLRAWLRLPQEKLDGLTDDSLLWIDIFCLDQFHRDKMGTIVKSAEIYGYAAKYYVFGLAIFDRVWCLAEIASVDKEKMLLVYEFDRFLKNRETVYKFFKMNSDPTFQKSRCFKEEDRATVKERIRKMKKESKEVHTIEFEKMDINGNKVLSSDELHAGLTRGCLQGRYNQDEIQEMFGKLDANKDGHVSIDEYLDYFIVKDFDEQVKEITDIVMGPFREEYRYKGNGPPAAQRMESA
jgi:hypothetical protein